MMVMTQSFLPYGRQSIGGDDIAAVTRVLRGDYLTTGPEIPAFEAEFASAVGASHGVACNSATAALHMALAGLGIGQGDVCIVPSITFLATANAARYCGADVVFADVDPASGLLTAATLSKALNKAGGRAKAVLPVHLAGALCDMAQIEPVAREAGLSIVEDSCHALGTVGPDGPVGNCARSDAATFSFHPVKTLAAGEGGMLATKSLELAEAAAQIRSHGIERDPVAFTRFDGAAQPWAYEMQALGYNYRMPDINAALGRSQLAKLGTFADRRRHLTRLYRDQLAALSPLVQGPVDQPSVDACRHLMNVAVDFDAAGVSRADVMERLRARGIGSQVHYVPVHTQPYYVERYGECSLPGAEHYYAKTLSLPLYPDMDNVDVERVVAALAESLERA